MRWPAYLALAYAAVGVQVGVGGLLTVRGVGPDLPLLVVVFASLYARPGEAMFAGLMTGLMQDMATVQPLGLFAFAYGATAAVVSRGAAVVRRGHPLAHVAAALVGGAVTGVLLVTHDWVRPAGPAVVSAGTVVARAVRIGPRTVLVSTLYTAVLAPIVVGPLGRAYRAFGFDPPNRRRHR